MSMIPIDYRTRHPLEDRREQLAALVEASGIHPVPVAGFTEVKPLPPRSGRIDPDTVPKRRPHGITRAQRRLLRQLAEAL